MGISPFVCPENVSQFLAALDACRDCRTPLVASRCACGYAPPRLALAAPSAPRRETGTPCGLAEGIAALLERLAHIRALSVPDAPAPVANRSQGVVKPKDECGNPDCRHSRYQHVFGDGTLCGRCDCPRFLEGTDGKKKKSRRVRPQV